MHASANPAGSSRQPSSAPMSRKGGAPILLYVINDIPFFISHRLPIARAVVGHGFDVHVAGQGASDSPT